MERKDDLIEGWIQPSEDGKRVEMIFILKKTLSVDREEYENARRDYKSVPSFDKVMKLKRR